MTSDPTRRRLLMAAATAGVASAAGCVLDDGDGGSDDNAEGLCESLRNYMTALRNRDTPTMRGRSVEVQFTDQRPFEEMELPESDALRVDSCDATSRPRSSAGELAKLFPESSASEMDDVVAIVEKETGQTLSRIGVATVTRESNDRSGNDDGERHVPALQFEGHEGWYFTAAYFLGAGTQVDTTAPQVQFEWDWDAGGGGPGTLTVTHTAGDSLDPETIEILVGGQRYCGGTDWAAEEIHAGDTCSMTEARDGDFGGETARVIWTPVGGEQSSTLGDFDVPK